MTEAELNLTPEQARLAELQVRAQLAESGEADLALSEAEKQALASASPADQAFLKGVGSAQRMLAAATTTFSPEATFTAKVMRALPAKPDAVPQFAVAKPAGIRWRVALVAAALVAAVVGVGIWQWPQRNPATPGPEVAKSVEQPAVSLAKGTLLNEQGQAVTALETGKTYKTGSEDVVLRTAQNALVRIAPQTAFEVRVAEGTDSNTLALNKGALCAQGSDAPVHVSCPEFNADVEGVSMVLRNFTDGLGEDQSIVLVFKGTARVQSATGLDPVDLNEGQVFVMGLDPAFGLDNPQPANAFLANAERSEKQLSNAKPDDWVRKRRMYAERVVGYKEDLKHLDQEIEGAADVQVRAEHIKRRAHVQKLLRQHEEVLNGLPEGGDPGVRVKRLHRSMDAFKKGQQWFRDPTKWL
jgi:hypothetical protein